MWRCGWCCLTYRDTDGRPVFKSMQLVASGLLCDRKRLGEQYFNYGQRVLEFDAFFHYPSLAPCGAFHELSKFHDLVAEDMPGIMCGRLRPNLHDVLDGTVLDWLGTAIAKVAAKLPLDRGAKDFCRCSPSVVSRTRSASGSHSSLWLGRLGCGRGAPAIRPLRLFFYFSTYAFL